MYRDTLDTLVFKLTMLRNQRLFRVLLNSVEGLAQKNTGINQLPAVSKFLGNLQSRNKITTIYEATPGHADEHAVIRTLLQQATVHQVNHHSFLARFRSGLPPLNLSPNI